MKEVKVWRSLMRFFGRSQQQLGVFAKQGSNPKKKGYSIPRKLKCARRKVAHLRQKEARRRNRKGR